MIVELWMTSEVSSDQTLLLLVEAIDNCGGDRYTFSDNPPINNQDGGIEGGNIRSVCAL